MQYIPALLLLFLYSANAYNINLKDLRLYVDCQEFVIKVRKIVMSEILILQRECAILLFLKLGRPFNQILLAVVAFVAQRELLMVNGVLLALTLTSLMALLILRTMSLEMSSNCFSDRDPPGPPNGWFQTTWERDFPILKELGVNTLRLYNMNPTTRKASIEQLGTNGIIEANGKDHIPFMDMAEQYGFKIIFPLVSDAQMLRANTPDYMKQLLKNQIDEVGNHSAYVLPHLNKTNFTDYSCGISVMSSITMTNPKLLCSTITLPLSATTPGPNTIVSFLSQLQSETLLLFTTG